MKKISVLIILLLITPFIIGATTSTFKLAPECGYADYPACTVCDIINLAINYAKLILGGISWVALLMFVIGGIYWITSAGNPERITKGKKILTAAIMGVVIVALAWVGVNTIIALLRGSQIASITNQTNININGKWTLWWTSPVCSVKKTTDCMAESTAVGTPCSVCSSGQGDTPCFCQVSKGYSDWQELETKGSCANNICICMSLCDKIVRDYPSTYSGYACVTLSALGEASYGTSTIGTCLTGDLCPHKEGQNPIAKCCVQP